MEVRNKVGDEEDEEGVGDLAQKGTSKISLSRSVFISFSATFSVVALFCYSVSLCTHS